MNLDGELTIIVGIAAVKEIDERLILRSLGKRIHFAVSGSLHMKPEDACARTALVRLTKPEGDTFCASRCNLHAILDRAVGPPGGTAERWINGAVGPCPSDRSPDSIDSSDVPAAQGGVKRGKRVREKRERPLRHHDADGVKARGNDRDFRICEELAADRDGDFLDANGDLGEGSCVGSAAKVVPERAAVGDNSLLPIVREANCGEGFGRRIAEVNGVLLACRGRRKEPEKAKCDGQNEDSERRHGWYHGCQFPRRQYWLFLFHSFRSGKRPGRRFQEGGHDFRARLSVVGHLI